MKRAWIEYGERWQPSTLSFWVHRSADEESVDDPTEYLAPPPGPVPGKGYARFRVEFNGFIFRFSSLEEMDVCIATLGQKLLPPSARQSRARGVSAGQHWLNQMPAKTKPWRYREKAVNYLTKVRQQFAQEVLQRQ